MKSASVKSANGRQITAFIENPRVCFNCVNTPTCIAANELRTFCEYHIPAVRRMDEVEEAENLERGKE